MESSNIRAAASLAASGYGVAFLSRGLLEQFHSICDYDAYELIDCDTTIRFAAAWRTGAYMPNYAKTFLELAHQEAEKRSQK